MGVSVSYTSINRRKKTYSNKQEAHIREMVDSYKQHILKRKLSLNSNHLQNEEKITSQSDTSCHVDYTSLQTSEDKTTAVEQDILPIEIIGDNVDIMVSPGTLTSDRQRKSWHWFLLLVNQKRVFNTQLPCEKPLRNVLHVPTSKWLPSNEEMKDLHSNMQHHVARMLLKYIQALTQLENAMPDNIQHDYCTEMSKKTVFRVCDLIDASENSSEGMVRILKCVHDLAVPHLGNTIGILYI